MTYRRVIEWPDKRLKLVSRSADISRDQQVFEDLKDTFRVTGGYGLSAPQIGLPVRAIVVNASALGVSDNHELLMVNPTIVKRTGTSFLRKHVFQFRG